MKKRSIVGMLAALFVFSLPMAALAMDHGKMEGMEHGGMSAQGNMIVLGEQTVNGIKCMAHLKDVHEAMAKMGMEPTHHLMVMFMDEITGKPIDEGTVAVKIKDPSGNVSEPVMLMGMQGHFGADIALTEKGKYEFTVGTKLADGEKRQYDFEYTVK